MTSTSRRRETPVGTPDGCQLVELAQHPTQARACGDRPRLRRQPRLAEAGRRVQARMTRVPRERHRLVQGGAHPAIHGQCQVEVVGRPRIPEQGQEVGDRQVGTAQGVEELGAQQVVGRVRREHRQQARGGLLVPEPRGRLGEVGQHRRPGRGGPEVGQVTTEDVIEPEPAGPALAQLGGQGESGRSPDRRVPRLAEQGTSGRGQSGLAAQCERHDPVGPARGRPLGQSEPTTGHLEALLGTIELAPGDRGAERDCSGDPAPEGLRGEVGHGLEVPGGRRQGGGVALDVVRLTAVVAGRTQRVGAP